MSEQVLISLHHDTEVYHLASNPCRPEPNCGGSGDFQWVDREAVTDERRLCAYCDPSEIANCGDMPDHIRDIINSERRARGELSPDVVGGEP